MVKKTLKQLDKEELEGKEFIKEARKVIKKHWGRKCSPHEEECPTCNAYKALNELERLYDEKETD